MLQIDPKTITPPELQKLLQGGIAPRPIALVSTISNNGVRNLSPFSFFNVFSSNPPIIGFSAARRGRDGTLKDTYNNLIANRECVVQSVSYAMVEQVSLSSTEYPSAIDEFTKSGLTAINSIMVKPPRVQESPFQMECNLLDMISFGEKGGAGNLALLEVKLIHVDSEVFTNGIIDPNKIDLVARMSGDYYSRAKGEAVFIVEKPLQKLGMGFDMLPEEIKNSPVLTGNDLGKLANCVGIPELGACEEHINKIIKQSDEHRRLDPFEFQTALDNGDISTLLTAVLQGYLNHNDKPTTHLVAQKALLINDTTTAWAILRIKLLGA